MTDNNGNLTRPEGKGIITLLSSMKMGLFLLLLLGAASSIGSLIPQGEAAGFYKAHYGQLMGSFIVLLSLDELYNCWWFIGLGTVFAINILCCSLRRIKTIVGARQMGSVLLHCSMLVIFVGSLVSGIIGKSVHIELIPGESINLATKGFPEYTLDVLDFEIEYYDTFEPKQYISSLALSGGESQVSTDISVNHPLKAEGFTIYQKSYGWKTAGSINIAGAEKKFDLINGDETPVAEHINLKTIFVPDFDPLSGSLQSKTPFPNNPHLACALVQHQQLIDVQVLAQGETKEVAGYPVTFSDYQYYTGLEVKRDPGVKIVYVGFALMTMGFLIRYFAPIKGKGSKDADKSEVEA
ncbi:cytochrome c biogenesis protein ResB [Peptococcaceae bacterium 1198_IL3148]